MISQLKELQQTLQKLGFLREAEETQNLLEGVMPSFAWLQDAEVLERYLQNFNNYNLENFIEDNSNILSQFDVAKYLGSGANGDAWLLDDNRVLKIAKGSASEYNELQDKLFKNQGNKNIPMVYEIGHFKSLPAESDFYMDNFFYVILEYTPSFYQKIKEHGKLSKKSEDIKAYFKANLDNILRILPALAREIPNDIEDFDTEDEISAFFKDYSREALWALKVFVSKNIRGIIGIGPKSFEEIVQIFNDKNYSLVTAPIKYFLGLPNDWDYKLLQSFYNNIKMDRHDLHSGNFGFRNEDVVFYDG